MFYLQILLCSLILSCGAIARSHNTKTNSCRELHEAVRKHDIPKVIELIRTQKDLKLADELKLANCPNEKGQKPLHVWAEIGGSKKMLLKLLHKGSAILDSRCRDGFTPFLVAVAYEREEAILALMALRTKENPVNVNAQSNHGFSALHLAVIAGSNEYWMKWLESLGVNPALFDKIQRTASKLAKDKGMLELSDYLSPVERWSTIPL
jgi:ankyrin repeat protein